MKNPMTWALAQTLKSAETTASKLQKFGDDQEQIEDLLWQLSYIAAQASEFGHAAVADKLETAAQFLYEEQPNWTPAIAAIKSAQADLIQ